MAEMNHQQWINAMHNNSKVKFTKKFIEFVGSSRIALLRGISPEVMNKTYTVNEMHEFKCLLVRDIENDLTDDVKMKVRNEECLDLLRHFLWDERKFAIMELVK